MSPMQSPPSRPPSHRAHAKRKYKVNKKRLALVSLLSFAVLLVLILGGGYLYIQNRLSHINRISAPSLAAVVANQPMNILLIGNNSRAALKLSEAQYFGSGAQVGGARSDVTMIAHFDPATGTVSLLSIPRDLFMPIPGTTTLQRVDDALNISPNQLIKTIEYDLGIPIQHFVELNFDSFQGVVNALGGIKMDFPMEVRDAESGLNVTTLGCQLLNGFQALEVVRARHLQYYQNGQWIEDPLGDLSRIRRDHIFLKVLAQQVRSKGLSNPITDTQIINSVINAGLTVDKNFSATDLIDLAIKYRHANPAASLTGTLPIAFVNNFSYKGVAGYGDVVFPEEPGDTALINQTLGSTTPAVAPGSINLTVLNGSGIAGQAGLVTQQLKALGYNAGTPGNATPSSSPAEAVIYYTPGHLTQAETLKASLTGEVIMGQVRATTAGTPIELLTGTQLGVAQKVTVQVTPTTSPAKKSGTTSTTSRSSTSTTAPSTHTVTSLPSITGATQVNLSEQPQPWDPRAC